MTNFYMFAGATTACRAVCPATRRPRRLSMLHCGRSARQLLQNTEKPHSKGVRSRSRQLSTPTIASATAATIENTSQGPVDCAASTIDSSSPRAETAMIALGPIAAIVRPAAGSNHQNDSNLDPRGQHLLPAQKVADSASPTTVGFARSAVERTAYPSTSPMIVSGRTPSCFIASAAPSVCSAACHASMLGTSTIRPTRLDPSGSRNGRADIPSGPKYSSRLGEASQWSTSSTSWNTSNVGKGPPEIIGVYERRRPYRVLRHRLPRQAHSVECLGARGGAGDHHRIRGGPPRPSFARKSSPPKNKKGAQVPPLRPTTCWPSATSWSRRCSATARGSHLRPNAHRGGRSLAHGRGAARGGRGGADARPDDSAPGELTG